MTDVSRKPLVGLTTTRGRNSFGNPTFTVNATYVQSIVSAGGLPVLIPLDLPPDDMQVLTARLDGILFTGGDDIDPRRYGSQPHPKVSGVDARRDQVEDHLVHYAIQTNMPFLGICRGAQVINVALGGSLYEDLPDQFPHALQHDNHDLPRNNLAHSVNVERESRLEQILGGGETRVNSLHHQGLRRLGESLQSSAFSPDGLVEAVELPGHPYGLAVQWHPEELQEHEAMRRLFLSFIQACQAAKSDQGERIQHEPKT